MKEGKGQLVAWWFPFFKKILQDVVFTEQNMRITILLIGMNIFMVCRWQAYNWNHGEKDLRNETERKAIGFSTVIGCYWISKYAEEEVENRILQVY